MYWWFSCRSELSAGGPSSCGILLAAITFLRSFTRCFGSEAILGFRELWGHCATTSRIDLWSVFHAILADLMLSMESVDSHSLSWTELQSTLSHRTRAQRERNSRRRRPGTVVFRYMG